MKFGIIVLLILGVVAAGSAALLVGTLSIHSKETKKADTSKVEVAKAKVDMPAMTVITLKHIETEQIPKDELPGGKALSPSQVIGKTLAVPVVEGQVLTASSLVTEGTGAHLVSYLPYGMRAVSVTLSSKSIPDQLLLYPGCIVDVLVSFRLSSSSVGSALSTTMLREVQVLAVQGESVVTKQDAEEQVTTKAKRSSGQVTVTLMVDTKQAEALQLAINDGSRLLTVRNPLDKKMVDTEATVLSQGRLAGLASVLTPAVFSEANLQEQLSSLKNSQDSDPEKDIQDDQNGQEDPNTQDEQQTQEKQVSILSLLKQSFLRQPLSNNDAQQSLQESNAEWETTQRQLISDFQNQQNQPRKYPKWGVTVIKGAQTTLQELEIPQNNDLQP
jgi:Flp pilus assembly protein CpaB